MTNAQHYNVKESNNISDMGEDAKKYRDSNICVHWSHPDLAKIVRMRFVTDPGFPLIDLSYCWGELKDGTPCRVNLPFHQLPKKSYHGAMLDYARRDKVFLKGLGIFNGTVISILW